MKKTLIWLLILIPAIATAQNKFILHIEIGNLNPPAKAYLFYKKGSTVVIDSATMVNGKAEFTGDISDPIWGRLTIDHDAIGLQNLNKREFANHADTYSLCIDKGDMIISSRDSLRNATYSGSGSASQKEFKEYSALIQSAHIYENRVSLTAYSYSSSKSAVNNKDSINRNNKAGGLPFRKTISTFDSLSFKFIKDHPNSYVSLHLLLQYSNNMPKLKTLYASLSPEIRKSSEGQHLAERINDYDFTAIGSIAPAFIQNDVNGKPVSLKDFRGKYVLLDFWASWCGPCRAENPNYVKAYHKYKDKNFTFLGVSLDRPGAKDAWLAAIQKDGLEWTQVSDLQFWNNAVAQLYRVKSVPTNYLIDPSGKIVAKNLRGDELDEKLAEIFK